MHVVFIGQRARNNLGLPRRAHSEIVVRQAFLNICNFNQIYFNYIRGNKLEGFIGKGKIVTE